MLLNSLTRKRDEEIYRDAIEQFEDVTTDPNALLRVESKYLEVPPEDEERAIMMGADYDADVRCFVVPGSKRLQDFKEWFPWVEGDLVSKDNTQSYLTKSGRALESVRHEKDSEYGWDSLAMPLMYAALPILAALTALCFSKGLSLWSALFLIPLILTIPYLITIEQSSWAGRTEAFKAFVLLYFAPAFCGALIVNGFGIVAVGLITAVLPPWFLFYSVLPFFKSELHLGKKQLMKGLQIGSTIFVAMLIAWVLGRYAIGALCAASAYYAVLYARKQKEIRFGELLDQSVRYRMSNVGSLKNPLLEQRRLQAVLAAADFTPRIELGESQGVLSEKGHILGVTLGATMRYTLNDATRGTIVVGKIGRGKTVVIRKVLYARLANNKVCDFLGVDNYDHNSSQQQTGGEQ